MPLSSFIRSKLWYRLLDSTVYLYDTSVVIVYAYASLDSNLQAWTAPIQI